MRHQSGICLSVLFDCRCHSLTRDVCLENLFEALRLTLSDCAIDGRSDGTVACLGAGLATVDRLARDDRLVEDGFAEDGDLVIRRLADARRSHC